jgi:hypothetical protein
LVKKYLEMFAEIAEKKDDDKKYDLKQLPKMVDAGCQAVTVEDAVEEVKAMMSLGHIIWAYAYLRALSSRDLDLCYGLLWAEPSLLLPVANTPTVGEACQKFGLMPYMPRGCYCAITDKGNVKEVLMEYARENLQQGPDGKFICQYIVFSNGY